ncbi:nucleotide exchange factor GrpE [Ruminococcus flavefaciens]|uniref:Protein GrpE n=1 Tax=Ruminococcus flavefaciens TaxID=1265 RepID=A0A1K1NMZ4_RUMFL|nr:nucleotide exchange factor GrpE [Ruminococcus flavefaciens]SFW36645.1 molecular chaperone GrpE [Ruminococcus flavefaciens]
MEENEKDTELLEELEEDMAEEAEENSDELDEADAASEYNDSAAQFADMEEALAEANDKYLRLFAEYDNYRKRTAKEKTETYQNASVQCVEKLLPVLDSFERSLEAECADENFKNGMAMIYNQFKNFLTQMNVTEIEALGAEFDPNVHNAIQQLDSTDYASNHVCSVFQKGYMLGDKLVRPAMVAVAV